MRRLLQVLAAVSIAAVVAYLFVRSAQNTRSEPYAVNAAHLRGWTLAWDAAPETSGVVLALRPPEGLAAQLFQQVFSRAMESLNAPARSGMPLLLQEEFERAFQGRVRSESLLAAAREAGLETTAIEPVCVALRRESAPGSTRQLYFAIVQTPAFQAFRLKAAALLGDATGAGSAFDPVAVTPVVFIGASDPGFRQWLAMPPDPRSYCVAPLRAAR